MHRGRQPLPFIPLESQSRAFSAGHPLAEVTIRHDRDLVTLRRRTRAAGDQLGLQSREVRSLSAATYEAAQVVFAQTGAVRGEIRLINGPALQVIIRAEAANGDVSALRERLQRALQPLESLVQRFAVDEEGRAVAVRLTMPTPQGAPERLQLTPREMPPPAQAEHQTDQELLEEILVLHGAHHELQAELQETNRGVIAMFAELEAQAEQLREAEDRFRLLLDSVQDYGICMLTPEGEITSWNSGAERLFGYSAGEIVGRNFACFFMPAERDANLPAKQLRAAIQQGRFECEGFRVRRGGSAFDAHVVLTPVRRFGRELCGFSLVVRDVTERKRLEDDLRRRADELAAANRAKEDFLATLSHELRTPLNAMLGWTRLLRMGKLDGAGVARALETIERNAHLQEQLIADILDVSRIVTGKLRLDLRPMELQPIVDAAADAVRPAADAKGIRLVVTGGDNSTIMADPDRLQQVIWNLLANAIKFTPAGGEIRLSLERAASNAVVTVADTGEGISPDLLPYVFDRFTQGDGSVTRPHGGLGLGLSIVRHIVELHGGKVQAQSDGPGCGATFTVYLPVRPFSP